MHRLSQNRRLSFGVPRHTLLRTLGRRIELIELLFVQPGTLGEMDTLLLDFNGTGLERGQASPSWARRRISSFIRWVFSARAFYNCWSCWRALRARTLAAVVFARLLLVHTSYVGSRLPS